ncbi:LADA_0F03598g1_1 [Lachancea dasiensis]|uniref:LADA_0F03598g1_1 n=1 Tax=Lachancea dasiensis TaxID=1072105 RepID=A0A1G4JIY8_9SACH|nr:LADA_0F03598g1_1 [Lachancea dasiensis]
MNKTCHDPDFSHDENAAYRAEFLNTGKPSQGCERLNVEKEPQALHPNAKNVRKGRRAFDPELRNLVAYLKQPEPLQTRDGRRAFEKTSRDSNGLSPALKLNSHNTKLEPFVPIWLRDDHVLSQDHFLDLSPVAQELPTSVNLPPMFCEEGAERALDPDDYEGICLAVLQEEFSRVVDNQIPVFEKQLELEEKKSKLSWLDYCLYCCCGLDKTGYFTLLREREEFQARPWLRFVGRSAVDSDDSTENDGAHSWIDGYDPCQL